MSHWINTLRAPSFKGVKFRVVTAPEIEVGRRTANHEYAGRDEPYSEDMGRKQRVYSIEGAVDGDDFIAQANALQDAFESPGAGVLVHPHYGELMVTCEATLRYEGRFASFTASFTEAGTNDYPGNRLDTRQQILNNASLAQTSAIEDFISSFDITGPGFIFDNAVSHITDTIDQIKSSIADIKNLVLKPLSLAETLFSSISSLGTSSNTNSVLTDLSMLISTSSTEEASAPSQANNEEVVTPSQQQIANNKRALNLLIDQAAVITMATKIVSFNFTDQKQAQQLTNKSVNSIQQVSWRSSDNSFQAIETLRISVQQDMQARMPKLPDLSNLKLQQSTPSLVIAYRHTGSIRAESALITRNQVIHPGFVTGNVEIVNV